MTWIRYSFTLNLKSLAAFRIGFGFLLLIDLYYRWIDASVFYTDYGVLPRINFIEKYLHAWKFSFHLANGSLLFIYFSLAVAALFALGLLLGYRTRLCAFVSWLLMISLQVRNPTILSGGR